MPRNTVLDRGPGSPWKGEIWGSEPPNLQWCRLSPNYFGPCYWPLVIGLIITSIIIAGEFSQDAVSSCGRTSTVIVSSGRLPPTSRTCPTQRYHWTSSARSSSRATTQLQLLLLLARTCSLQLLQRAVQLQTAVSRDTRMTDLRAVSHSREQFARVISANCSREHTFTLTRIILVNSSHFTYNFRPAAYSK